MIHIAQPPFYVTIKTKTKISQEEIDKICEELWEKMLDEAKKMVPLPTNTGGLLIKRKPDKEVFILS